MTARRTLLALSLCAVLGSAEATPTCDSIVSPTAMRMALASANPAESVELVTLESFGIDPAMRPVFRMLFAQEMSTNGNDAAALATALTASMSGLCRSFHGGKTPVVAPIVIAPSEPRTMPPQPTVREDQNTILEAKARTVSTGRFPNGTASQNGAPDPTQPETPGPADPANPPKGETPKAPDCSKLAPGVLETACPRTMIEDLGQSRIRESVMNAQHAYVRLRDRLKRQNEGVTEEMVEKAAKDLQEVEQNALLILPNYGLYFGPAFALDSEGGFQPRAEFYAKFDSGRMFYPSPFRLLGENEETGEASGWARGYFDLTYLTKDTEQADDTPGDLDLFGRDNGRLRFNAGLQLHPFEQYGDWIGFEAGVGMTVPQEDGDAERETGRRAGRTRWFAGLHSQTTYRFGIGEVFLGIADDRFYDVTCGGTATAPACGDFSKRYIAEGLFTLADNAASDWSVIGKVTADLPRDHEGDSDVVISVLLRRDLDGYLAGFGDGK